jgi:GNAT superfamily N-acetyltransferase
MRHPFSLGMTAVPGRFLPRQAFPPTSPEPSPFAWGKVIRDASLRYHATFGYLSDVFVLEEHRGQGLSIAMTKALLELPEVRGFRRIMLATRDAHGVYEQCGFQRIEDSAPFMQILRKDIYAI